MREISPYSRCKICGSVTVALVLDRGIADDGEPYLTFFRDTIPHSAKDCDQMQALVREEWPTLW